MKVRVVRGNIADLRAEVLCSSTNPRLSLYEGTGGDLREKGGWAIKRECEAILEAETQRTGQSDLRVGSAHLTNAGELPAKIIIHCVASDPFHRSSRAIIASCVGNALAIAHNEGCRSIAMPVFATGHAAFRFESAIDAMAEAIVSSQVKLEEVSIALLDHERIEDVRRALMARGIEVVTE